MERFVLPDPPCPSSDEEEEPNGGNTKVHSNRNTAHTHPTSPLPLSPPSSIPSGRELPNSAAGRRALAARLYRTLLPLLVEAAGAPTTAEAVRLLDRLAPLLFPHGVGRVALVTEGGVLRLQVDLGPDKGSIE